MKTRKLQSTSTKELKIERTALIDSLDLCEICKPIVKHAFLEDIGSIHKKEKGIDIMIATDMIKRCMIDKECDCCILISGDADFIPAMQIIKDFGRGVITASVASGYSRELRNGRFRYYIVKRQEISEKCVEEFRETKKR